MFASCSKEEATHYTERAVVSGKLIKSISFDDETMYEYEYENGKVSSVAYRTDMVFEFDYPSQDHMTVSYKNAEYSLKLNEKGLPISIASLILTSDSDIRYGECVYNDNGLITQLKNDIYYCEEYSTPSWDVVKGSYTSYKFNAPLFTWTQNNSAILDNFNVPLPGFSAPFINSSSDYNVYFLPFARYSSLLPLKLETVRYSAEGQIVKTTSSSFSYERNEDGDIYRIIGGPSEIRIEYY